MASDARLPANRDLPDRVLSIDALRGFDMFWIMEAEEIVHAWAKYSGSPLSRQLSEQFEHAPWEGFRFYDLIFPLFLFLVGAVLPYSLGKLQERGEPRGALYWRVLRRTVLLFALGLLYNNVLKLDFANLRYTGVLQRIALCYGAAGLIFLNTRVRTQIVLLAAILIGYWALFATVAAPDSHPGDFSIEKNLGGYIDRHFLPGRIYKAYYGYGDNEGLLSTIPAVGTALLGVLAGQWLRTRQGPWRKALGLALAGVVCLGLGFLWGASFPIIKNLWTSSFVLVAGGWSLLLLALFYTIIDILQFRAWSFFFVVIGMNPITIYVLARFVDFGKIADFFFGGTLRHTGELHIVLVPVSVLAVKWLLLLYLYHKRIFLRV
jgi:predicted acyltransferase